VDLDHVISNKATTEVAEAAIDAEIIVEPFSGIIIFKLKYLTNTIR
jgi:hypothetical protein